jgi:hypothetical protein
MPSPRWSAAQRALVWAIRSPFPLEGAPGVPALGADVDWPEVARQARKHALEPLFHAAVAKLPVRKAIPAEVIETLRTWLRTPNWAACSGTSSGNGFRSFCSKAARWRPSPRPWVCGPCAIWTSWSLGRTFRGPAPQARDPSLKMPGLPGTPTARFPPTRTLLNSNGPGRGFVLVFSLPRQMPLHCLHDLRGGDLQHFRNLDQGPNGGVSDAPFNEADVRSVKASFQGQPLLGDLAAFADLPKRLAERLLGSRRWMELSIWSWCHRPGGVLRESSRWPYQFSSRRPARSCPSSARREGPRCTIHAASATAAAMTTNAQAISRLVAAAAPTSQFFRPDWT